MFSFGGLFQAILLLVNAVAVLSEDRFLARIGWASYTTRARAAASAGFNQSYDQSGYGQQQVDVGITARLIDLITAIRTVARIPLIAVNIVVILYSLIW